MSDVKVNWFEIPVSDEGRSSIFYEALLDRKLGAIDGPNGPMRVFMSADGAEGSLSTTDSKPSADGVVIYLNCPDIDAALGRCKGAGGNVVQPRTSIGPFGHIAMVTDPDGNRIGLHCGN